MMLVILKGSVTVTISTVLIVVCRLLSETGVGATAGSSLQQLPLLYRVIEESKPGTFVANLKQDGGLMTSSLSAQPLVFSLIHDSSYFHLDNVTGILRTSGRLDREELCPMREECLVSVDFVAKPDMYFRKVNVEVEDINDNAPKFPTNFVSLSVSEASPPGQPLFPIDPASDPDSPSNGVVFYRLEPEEDARHQPFHLVQDVDSTGTDFHLRLALQYPIDRERQSFYQVKVVAVDGGDRSGSVTLDISVEDVNDNSPRFINSTHEVEITENAPPDSHLVVLRAVDDDVGLNGKVVYSLSDSSRSLYGNLFSVHRDTGIISQLEPIDYEEHRRPIVLEVIARDVSASSSAGSSTTLDSYPATALVVVNIRDVNDNSPKFRFEPSTAETGSENDAVGRVESVSNGDASTIALRVNEHSPNDQFLGLLSVEDLDSGSAGRVYCSMPSSHFQLIQIYEKEYKLSTGPGDIDREIQDMHRLIITCNDMGQPVRSTSIAIDVFVDDINDNDPQFSEAVYSWSLAEDRPAGDVIGRISASDPDLGPNGRLIYRAEEGYDHLLTVNSTTGNITVSSGLDREMSPSIHMLVYAIDNGLEISRTSTATIEVNILDVDDERPHFVTNWFVYYVPENASVHTEVGRPTAVDLDPEPQNNRMSFYLDTSGDARLNDVISDDFQVDHDTGAIFTRRPLDRETRAVYNMTVAVQSMTSLNHVETCHVTIHVTDVNDCAPEIIYPSSPHNDTLHLSGLKEGPIATVVATDADVGINSRLRYSIASWRDLRKETSPDQRNDESNSRYFIDSETGKIYAVKRDQLSATATKLLLTVKDGGLPSLTSSAELTVIVDSVESLLYSVGEGTSLSFLSLPLGGVSLAIFLAGLAGTIVLIMLMTVAAVIARRNRKLRNRRVASPVISGTVSRDREAVSQNLWPHPDPLLMSSPTDSITSSGQRCSLLIVDDVLSENANVISHGDLSDMQGAVEEIYNRSRSGTMTSNDNLTRPGFSSSRDQVDTAGCNSPRMAAYNANAMMMASLPSPKLKTFANNWTTLSPTHSNSNSSNAGTGSRYGTLERRTVRFKDDLSSISATAMDTSSQLDNNSLLGSLPPPPPPLAIDTFGDLSSYTSAYRLPFPVGNNVV